MTPILDDRPLRRRPDMITATVDADAVVLDVDRGLYFGFDAVAAEIWAMLGAPVRPSDICARLLERYAVDEATCVRDVGDHLAELLREDLVAVVDAP